VLMKKEQCCPTILNRSTYSPKWHRVKGISTLAHLQISTLI
jgi:hypothetical protein